MSWIKCSERMPDKWQDVVVNNPTTGWTQVVQMNHDQSAWTLGDNGDFQRVKIDQHTWYPIPAPVRPPPSDD